jgi:D-apiose dehydrogenase
MSSIPRLRGALIGCGFVARHHFAAWRNFSDVELTAICDLIPERLERAIGQCPRARPYTSASDMFAAEQLDFVEICTRPPSHRPLTEWAAAHGVHVLCQKPAAETRADLLTMIAACRSAGVRLMIHENWRFRPWYRAMKQTLDGGAIGRPIRLRLTHRDCRALVSGGFADQPYFADMPRLLLFEMGPHLVDTARFLMGEVSAVSATLGTFGPGHAGDDVGQLSLRFESGAVGLLDISWCAPADVSRPEWALNETVVEGTEGAVRLVRDGSLRVDFPDGATRKIEVDLPSDDQTIYLDGYITTQRHFLRGLHDASFVHETSGDETLKTMDVIWAGYQSNDEGRVVSLT